MQVYYLEIMSEKAEHFLSETLSLMLWLVTLLPVGILLATCPIFCNPEKISHDIVTAATCNPLLGLGMSVT